MSKKPNTPSDFEIKREDPPDQPDRRIIDWSVRLTRLAELVKKTKDPGWYVIGTWPGVGSAHHYKKKLDQTHGVNWEFKAWQTTKGEGIKSKLYARRKE
jgi:hypothetical protein